MDRQKNAAYNIRHEKHTIKNKTKKDREKKLGAKITLIILSHKK